MKEIGDANTLRGEEFGKMVRRPLPWILIIAGAVVLAVLGHTIGGAGVAASLSVRSIITTTPLGG